jgi:hypothetical protein
MYYYPAEMNLLVAGITADQLPDKPQVFTAKDFVRERTRRDSSA